MTRLSKFRLSSACRCPRSPPHRPRTFAALARWQLTEVDMRVLHGIPGPVFHRSRPLPSHHYLVSGIDLLLPSPFAGLLDGIWLLCRSPVIYNLRYKL